MAGRWMDLPAEVLAWRREIVDCLHAFDSDVVVFCHFIVINVVVGAATGAEALITFRPANGSVTRMSTDDGRLSVIELGAEADSRVN